MFDVVTYGIAVTDAFESETGCRLKILNEVSSVDPNPRLRCVARTDPNSSAANSGTVITQFPNLERQKTLSPGQR
jgi:hypothetical protein